MKKQLLLKPNRFTETCGWYGMAALVTAYGLASFGFIAAEGTVYQLLNLSGSLALIIVALSKNVLQIVLLNLFWAAIGLIALGRIYL